jgi:hypothetical protein
MGLLLRGIDLFDRRLQRVGELGPARRRRSGDGLALRDGRGSAQLGEHLIEIAGIDGHALFIAKLVPEIYLPGSLPRFSSKNPSARYWASL